MHRLIVLLVLCLVGCGSIARQHHQWRVDDSIYEGVRNDIKWSMQAPSNGLTMCGGRFDLATCIIYGPVVAAGTLATGLGSLPFDATIDTMLLSKDIAKATKLKFDLYGRTKTPPARLQKHSCIKQDEPTYSQFASAPSFPGIPCIPKMPTMPTLIATPDTFSTKASAEEATVIPIRSSNYQ